MTQIDLYFLSKPEVEKKKYSRGNVLRNFNMVCILSDVNKIDPNLTFRSSRTPSVCQYKHQSLVFRCSSFSAKHLRFFFFFFFFSFFFFFLGVRAIARNTYCYCSVFFFFFFFLLLLLLPLRPIDCRQKNTYLQTSHELETWHVLRT